MEMVISRVRADEVCNNKKLGYFDGVICVTLISRSWVGSHPCVQRSQMVFILKNDQELLTSTYQNSLVHSIVYCLCNAFCQVTER